MRQYIALAAELGLHRRLLYKWRDQLEAIDDEGPPEDSKAREQRLQVTQLKRLATDKTPEVESSQRCLAKTEARRKQELN